MTSNVGHKLTFDAALEFGRYDRFMLHMPMYLYCCASQGLTSRRSNSGQNVQLDGFFS